jgi:hypothetical protein
MAGGGGGSGGRYAIWQIGAEVVEYVEELPLQVLLESTLALALALVVLCAGGFYRHLSHKRALDGARREGRARLLFQHSKRSTSSS